MIRDVMAASILMSAAFAPTGGASAQTTGLTTTLSAATDYHSKGISKSLDDGFLSIGSEWVSANGMAYAGAAAATVDLTIGATYEADLRAGVRPKAMGWAFDLAVFYRAFPDAVAGSDDDYVEARAQASRTWGPVSLRLLSWQTPDNLGAAGAANWSEAKIATRLANGIRGSVALGHHQQENAPSYAAWNAGLSIDLRPGVEMDLRWYDTDEHQAGDRFRGEAVAALSYRY